MVVFNLSWSCCSVLLHPHSASGDAHPKASHGMSWNEWLHPAKLSKQGREQQKAEPEIPEVQSCGCENPQQSSGPEPRISKAGLGRIIFHENTVKNQTSRLFSYIFFSLFHGTNIGLKFNLLLLLWVSHQHFTRLLKKLWNLYLTQDNCVIYCLGVFYLMILENKLFIGLYFSTPVTLWLWMFSPGWRLLGNKLEKILKTLTPSSAHNSGAVEIFFFSAGRKRFLYHNALVW